MKKKPEDKWFAVNGEWFDSQFSGFIMSEKGMEISQFLRGKNYKVSDTNETYRVINSWSESDLLLEDTERENGWRKFSLVDLCWIQILKELRGLGFSLEKLRILKKSLFETYPSKKNKEGTLLFEFFLAKVISKTDIILIVTSQGYGSFLKESEYHNFQVINSVPNSFIVISLNKLYADLVKKPELKIKNQMVIQVDEKEKEIFERIAFEKNLSEITIQPKKGKVSRVQFKTTMLNPEKAVKEVRDMLKEKGRKKILVTQEEDGKVVFIERVDKT